MRDYKCLIFMLLIISLHQPVKGPRKLSTDPVIKKTVKGPKKITKVKKQLNQSTKKSVETTVHSIFPNECFNDKMKGKEDYLPKPLLNDERLYLCQRPWGHKLPDVKKEQTQYVTLFDARHRIPIYSAYIAEPWKDNGKGEWEDSPRQMPDGQERSAFQDTSDTLKEAITTKIKKKQEMKMDIVTVDEEDEDLKGTDKRLVNKDKDYIGWDSLDRGHLFPVQFTRDWIENKSTSKITNTVPQDNAFNSQQWKTVETVLKKIAIKKCQEEKGEPLLITGSVPNYYGKNKQSKLFKIGCKDNSKEVCPRTDMIVTVPTHMWSTMRCIQKVERLKKPKTLFHTSLIGSNHKDGRIVWYEKFTAFEQDLKEMMHQKTSELFATKSKSKSESTNTDDDFAITPNQARSTEMIQYIKAIHLNKNQVFHGSDKGYEGWEKHDIHSIRKHDIESKMIKEVHHLGASMKTLSGALEQKAKDIQGQNRKKRNVDSQVDSSTYLLVRIDDKDPDADIEISKIKLTETYQNGEENLSIDFKTNQIIPDKNNQNENSFKASLDEKGEETELTEGQSSDKFIRIELIPRNML